MAYQQTLICNQIIDVKVGISMTGAANLSGHARFHFIPRPPFLLTFTAEASVPPSEELLCAPWPPPLFVNKCV